MDTYFVTKKFWTTAKCFLVEQTCVAELLRDPLHFQHVAYCLTNNVVESMILLGSNYYFSTTVTLLIKDKTWYFLIYIQQDAKLHSLFISGNCEALHLVRHISEYTYDARTHEH